MTVNMKITNQELVDSLVGKIDEIDVVKTDVNTLKDSIDAALLSGQHADQVSQKVGDLNDLATDVKDDLVGAINSTEAKVKDMASLPSDYMWTANAGQLEYTLPAGSSYDTSLKGFQVEVAGGIVSPDLINKISSTKFALLLPSTEIYAGFKVVARWDQSLNSGGSGTGSSIGDTGIHHTNHELGGTDEIDVTKLKGYSTNVSGKIGDTSTLQTASKTNLVSSVNELVTKSNTNSTDITNISNKIGSLGSLETNVQTSIVDAINDVNRKTAGSPDTIGDLDDLYTVNKSTIVGAVNENTTKIGTVSSDSDNVGEDNGMFWIPPVQPAMPWGSNGVPATKDPEGFINGLYEPLRIANPSYISRTTLGLDQSGTYNVYRYELTPQNYTKTIIVSAGTHGNEYTASFALARFIYHLVNDWKKYPQLTYIRKNVRLIVHPINNPHSFANNKRQNANGVDLNRNMAYLWDYITGASFQVGGTYYKGTAPFSEKESQYLRDSFVLYSDALSYVDFHTINTIQAEHIVFTPRYRPQFREIFNDNISRLFKTGNRIVNGTTAMPTIACHAAVTHDMTTANPEWYNGIYGGNRDSVEMTEAVKWFGNVVIKACSLKHKTTQIEESHPFTKLLMYDKGATPSTITSTVYNNVTHATYDMIIKRHGIMRLNGYVKFTLSTPATVGVNPIIYQVNHPEQGYTETKDQVYNEVLQTLAAGTYVVPLNARFHVFPHNYNEAGTSRPEQTKFRLRMKTSAGTVTIESWRVYLDYLPSERGIAYEIVDFTGKEALAEGSDYSIVFPDPTKFVIDGAMEE